MSWAIQPLGRGGTSGGQRSVENWASCLIWKPRQKSMASPDEWRVKLLIVVYYPDISFEFPLSTVCLWYALISVSFYLDTGGRRYKEGSERARQLSLTWSLMRKTVLVNKGRKVRWLGEVLLVRVQVGLHVVQGCPLLTGGGGQLLLVRGVVVLLVEGGRFICGRGILKHSGG